MLEPRVPPPRLPEPYGLWVDRNQTVTFSFEGQSYSGLQGDTIATALAANGQWLLSRSFKYHRPRGLLTLAGQDANTLVQLLSDPNALADRVSITEGLLVQAQNFSGTLKRDRNAILGWLAPFLPVAFYYKAFFRPRGVWQLWARFFRKRAGLGVIDQAFKPKRFAQSYRHCDILVIGGGAAGLAASIAAAEAGADVLLVDENVVLGGSLNYTDPDLDESSDTVQRDALLAIVEQLENLEVLTSAMCNGWYADNWIPVVQGEHLLKVRAQQVIFATGSLEQPVVFRNNDLPGIMMSSAAMRLVQLYGVQPGQKGVVVCGNWEGYRAALMLAGAGVRISGLVDFRVRPDDGHDLIDALDLAGIPIWFEHGVDQAIASVDQNHVAGVDVGPLQAGQVLRDRVTRLTCDFVAMAGGYVPTYQLACQAGGRLLYDDALAAFSIAGLPEDCWLAGSVNGVWHQGSAHADGVRAGKDALQALGLIAERGEPEPGTGEVLNYGWPIFEHPKGKAFVDFDEDLQINDILNATREGYEHIQLVKRYSTAGMGPSQGRHSALTVARLVAAATGKTVAETGVTTARPPFAAEQLAHTAGRGFFLKRHSAMHHRHVELGAQMMQAGAWFRPAFYGPAAEQNARIQTEIHQVRTGVGMIDVSTLGGIEVRGVDAAEFLNRVYTGGFKKQPIGKARYALLINEAGVVLDDGVACRLHEKHFYVTATTGGVDSIYRTMLKWNAQWRLKVDIANVTSAYCAINIAGPKARTVLARVAENVDLSPEAFPYMGVRTAMLAGVAVRLIRVGFVGELGFEIHAPQQYGEALWDLLMAAGEESGIQPFGVEAQRGLRLEKAHIIVGQDTDAMTNPFEIQMDWALSRKKPYFVGHRTLQELEQRSLTRVLAGFMIKDVNTPQPLESHLVLDGNAMIGRVTSCMTSQTLNAIIGLAYVPVALAKPGCRITIKVDDGQCVIAEIVPTPFYDPESHRQELES
ncbi:MAG: FAD-dependent oxidoreductase [Gammaproteobacteria bacterium]|jgi:sarcosine oxidase subunit alpha|nr:FAD-dependent oxidoreductase [Gammaproteobacteria bacterium]